MSKLTSLSVILYHVAATNWLPTSNLASVTFEIATLIYKLKLGLPVDLVRRVFNHMAKIVHKGNSSILPYPSLIYKVLLSQGFTPKAKDDIEK